MYLTTPMTVPLLFGNGGGLKKLLMPLPDGPEMLTMCAVVRRGRPKKTVKTCVCVCMQSFIHYCVKFRNVACIGEN